MASRATKSVVYIAILIVIIVFHWSTHSPSGGRGDDDGGFDDNDGGGGGGGGSGGSGDFGADASGGFGVYAVSNMNCTKFSAYCREHVLSLTPDLQFSRVHIKCVAVRCILIAMAHINGNPLHSDVAAARAATDRALKAIKGKYTSEASLAAVPRYLPLFLTDLVNLSCACATYMIDDKPVLALQAESMVLMRQVVQLFLYSEDPDIKLAQLGSGSGGCDGSADASSAEGIALAVEGRILHQFTSQLLSAVRSGLSNTHALHNPDLLYTAGEKRSRIVVAYNMCVFAILCVLFLGSLLYIYISQHCLYHSLLRIYRHTAMQPHPGRVRQ